MFCCIWNNCAWISIFLNVLAIFMSLFLVLDSSLLNTLQFVRFINWLIKKFTLIDKTCCNRLWYSSYLHEIVLRVCACVNGNGNDSEEIEGDQHPVRLDTFPVTIALLDWISGVILSIKPRIRKSAAWPCRKCRRSVSMWNLWLVSILDLLFNILESSWPKPKMMTSQILSSSFSMQQFIT